LKDGETAPVVWLDHDRQCVGIAIISSINARALHEGIPSPRQVILPWIRPSSLPGLPVLLAEMMLFVSAIPLTSENQDQDYKSA
jgi:hypothetical protein